MHGVPLSHRALSLCRSPTCRSHWGAVTDPTTPLKRLTRAFNVRAAAVFSPKRFGKTVGEYPGDGPLDMVMSGTMLGNVCDNTRFNLSRSAKL